MRVLFCTAHFGFLRLFEPALLEMLSRGHRVELAHQRDDGLGGSDVADRLRRAFPDQVTIAQLPRTKQWDAYTSVRGLRLCLDYLRYLSFRYDAAPKLRARAASLAPPRFVRLMASPLMRTRPLIALVRLLLRGVERAMPTYPLAREFVAANQPDLLLVTPLLYFGSMQVELVRAAKEVGVRSVLCVGSWDHLTTKGLIHEIPNRVIVWNENQRSEAHEFHGVAPHHVYVTGAQAYDPWFELEPRDRTAFCRRIGLEPAGSYLLYLCSSEFIAPDEHRFVADWLRVLRTSEQLQTIGVLIRPHPQNAAQWRTADLAGFKNVVVWPPGGSSPMDEGSRRDYFDSMFHSAAVVGVNTSGLIEAGIVGRPVLTVLEHSFSDTQGGTLHFGHLVRGGLLQTARDLGEHVGQLEDCLACGESKNESARSFVEEFVRPCGLELPAAAVFVDTIEKIDREVRQVSRVGVWRRGLRLLFVPVATCVRLLWPPPWSRESLMHEPLVSIRKHSVHFARGARIRAWQGIKALRRVSHSPAKRATMFRHQAGKRARAVPSRLRRRVRIARWGSRNLTRAVRRRVKAGRKSWHFALHRGRKRVAGYWRALKRRLVSGW